MRKRVLCYEHEHSLRASVSAALQGNMGHTCAFWYAATTFRYCCYITPKCGGVVVVVIQEPPADRSVCSFLLFFFFLTLYTPVGHTRVDSSNFFLFARARISCKIVVSDKKEEDDVSRVFYRAGPGSFLKLKLNTIRLKIRVTTPLAPLARVHVPGGQLWFQSVGMVGGGGEGNKRSL